jgi:hypothetical protein
MEWNTELNGFISRLSDSLPQDDIDRSEKGFCEFKERLLRLHTWQIDT